MKETDYALGICFLSLLTILCVILILFFSQVILSFLLSMTLLFFAATVIFFIIEGGETWSFYFTFTRFFGLWFLVFFIITIIFANVTRIIL